MPKCDFNKFAYQLFWNNSGIEKMFWKYATRLQENIHAKVWFQ